MQKIVNNGGYMTIEEITIEIKKAVSRLSLKLEQAKYIEEVMSCLDNYIFFFEEMGRTFANNLYNFIITNDVSFASLDELVIGILDYQKSSSGVPTILKADLEELLEVFPSGKDVIDLERRGFEDRVEEILEMSFLIVCNKELLTKLRKNDTDYQNLKN